MPPTKRAPARRAHAHALDCPHELLDRISNTNDLIRFHRHPHHFPNGVALRFQICRTIPFFLPRLSPSPLLARHRSSSGPVLSPPPPRLELAVGLDEPLEHLHDEWPHLDRLAVRLAVVARVGGQRRVKLAGDSSLERYVGVGLHRLEFHGRTVSSYGPGNTRSWVTITLKA